MDIPRLDAWSLHCLVVLVRERSVTRAGAVLGLSQPATSAILAKLRVLFQDPILVKSASAMVPSQRGIEMAALAQRLLADMQDLLRPSASVFDAAKFVGSVSFAATDIVRLLVMPPLMQVLQREAPGLSVVIDNADRTRIHERLDRSDVDLGLGPRVVSTNSLHFRELWRDTAICLASAARVEDLARLDAKGFAALGHIRLVPSKPSYFDELLDRALAQVDLRRRVVISERSFLMVPSLIRSTDLVATVPRRFAKHACQLGELGTFELPMPLDEMSIGLYWHERTHREPVFQWLRERICDVVRA